MSGTVQKEAEARRPKVGVGVLIFRGTKVIVGKRKSALGDGQYALPGGHQEFGESFEECATREVLEETGLELKKPKFRTAVSTVLSPTAHYCTIFMQGEIDENAEPLLMEPDKCEEWMWAEWSALPEPLFQPLKSIVDQGFMPDAA